MTRLKFFWFSFYILIGITLLVSCQIADLQGNNVRVQETELLNQEICINSFIPHKLSFANGMRVREIGLYLNNGSGLAINDLDDDDDLDIVFTAVDREVGIFWNQGNLQFEEERLDEKFPRGVAVVDVDGDGNLDLVFSHRGLKGITYWRNLGKEIEGSRFEVGELPGVDSYAYTQAWGDVDGDGDLDLVTGSYNVELIQNGIAIPERDERAGVFYYEQTPEGFIPQRLALSAETLSIALVDLDDDGYKDLWVANDFDLQDQTWLWKNDRWQAATPFQQTPHSTMSTEWGFIANDNRLALFSTDMMPYDHSPETEAAWAPVMESMMMMEMGEMGSHEMEGDHDMSMDHHMMPMDPGDPQIMENVLQMPREGVWDNEAKRRGIAASGWAWSAKFGDLDKDGYQDLYIVNGMIGINMFGHLTNHELVEENQAYQNLENGVFEPAPQWRLNATESGRGMVMADMDLDGDLDIVVNNLRASAYLFENQLCDGSALEVELQWPDSANRNAIGTQLELRTSIGTLTRDLRASGGYLSGDPFRVHFGFPEDTELFELKIIWPDGQVTQLDDIDPQTLIKIIR
jgi:hypothetical protein